ncbi:MAG TPA: MarR family winged helix-turn-helix transcriptional regulator [Kofleriaceae bacterium]
MSYAIWQLARTHRAYAATLLRELDLFPSQELMIMSLSEKGPQTQTELVKHLGCDHSTVAKSLTRMEAAGLIARCRSQEDRRATVVSLTRKGEAIQTKIDAAWERLERATVAALSPDQRKQLVRLMAQVEQHVAGVAADG